MDPTQWGPCVWRAIHVIALGYPTDPSPQDVEEYKAFFTALGPVLPCRACSDHYEKNLKKLPIDKPLQQGGRALFDWTVELHNRVNRFQGKRELSPDEAFKIIVASTSKSSSGFGASIDFTSPAQAFSLGVGFVFGGIITGIVGFFICKKVMMGRRK